MARPRIVLALLLLGASVGGAHSAVARGPLVVGVGDQRPGMFGDPRFTALHVHQARLVTPWDSVFTEPERLDAWLQAARAAGVQPLVSFEAARGDRCPDEPCNA